MYCWSSMATAKEKATSFEDFSNECMQYLLQRGLNRPLDRREFPDETHMLPPCYQSRYLFPLDKNASGFTPGLIDQGKVEGGEAERKVFETLRNTKQPMFVFTNFEIEKFLKLKSISKLLGDAETLTKEIDFIIIHRHVGIILIEVKAAKKLSMFSNKKAIQQLDSSETFLRVILKLINPDLSTSVPVFKVIAMPNLSYEQHTDRVFTSEHSKYCVNLCSDDLKDEKSFMHWWDGHFKVEETVQGLFELAAILVGQRAAIGDAAKILAEVFKTIDTQAFLEKGYKKQAKTRKEAVTITKNHPVLRKKWLFLNPDQLSVFDGPKWQLIHGQWENYSVAIQSIGMRKEGRACGDICTRSPPPPV